MWSFVILFGKTFFEILGEQTFVFAYGVDVVGGDSYFFFFAFDTVVDLSMEIIIGEKVAMSQLICISCMGMR